MNPDREAYSRWLAEHGLCQSARGRSRREILAEAESLDRKGDVRMRNAKHAPTPRDHQRALDRADAMFAQADELRASLPQVLNPCPMCGEPLPPFGDPCKTCQQTNQPGRKV